MNENNAIKAARQLGRELQKDERYVAYHTAKEKNDTDSALNDLINEFNLVRQKLNLEISKPTEQRDDSYKEKLDSLNAEAQGVYVKIMDNPNMKAFTDAKTQMDEMIQEVSTIISLCCDGENPDTCQLPPPPAAGGCASGGGCTGCGKH
ncbi:MAG: YlbF family regulator [Oscillospiraceae bacterium]|nr:YlbF family regulator [Oscillospiraceae bacterium]